MTQQRVGERRHWTEADIPDIPDLSGRTAVVTGADQARLWQTSEELTGVSYAAALG
jgi:hypothetical protein